MNSRKSIRAFLPEPVSDEVLRELLATASRSPSGVKVQPWRIYVVNGDSMDRFRGMVTAFDSQLDNYDTIKETSLYPIALIVLVAGLLIAGCGVWRFVVDQREDKAVAHKPA